MFLEWLVGWWFEKIHYRVGEDCIFGGGRHGNQNIMIFHKEAHSLNIPGKSVHRKPAIYAAIVLGKWRNTVLHVYR